MAAVIRAAGGLLWRPAADPLVCVVHRPRYDDWSLPKGKLRPGEHPLAGAIREVREETGVRPVPQVQLPPARYLVGGVAKQVDYWAMVAADAAPPAAPHGSEVDVVEWLPIPAAIERVSHAHDAALLHRWSLLPPVTGVIILVRHADAGSRASWSAGTDELRPLSPTGIADAARLCRLLALCAPTRLVSASPLRCQQTLAPLATQSGLALPGERIFDEAAEDPVAAARRLVELASDGGTTVVCSQGAVIPPALAWLADVATKHGSWPVTPEEAGGAHETGRSSDWATVKGDGWLLPCSGPVLVGIAPLRSTNSAPPR